MIDADALYRASWIGTVTAAYLIGTDPGGRGPSCMTERALVRTRMFPPVISGVV